MKHVVVGLALALSVGAADAAVVTWSADLKPENEVPPVTGIGATGSATGTVDTATGLLTWEVIWSGLTGPATAAHFHGPAGPGVNAGVQVFIGTAPMTPAIGSATIDGSQMSDLLSELWYINVHTQANSGGEIRGQVIPNPIPVPATLPLMLGSGLMLVLARRRGT